MAGLRITVCLPACEAERVEAEVARVMAPFALDYSRGEELDIWDGWYITSGLPVLPGHEFDERLLAQSPMIHLISGPEPAGTFTANEFGWCAGGPRELLDLPSAHEHRERTRMRADALWRRWHELAAELPAARSRRHFRESEDMRTSEAVDRATRAYAAQPLIRAFERHLDALPSARATRLLSGPYDPVEEIAAVTREEYLASVVDHAVAWHNIVSLEGWWYEDGGPGIHGHCPGTAECPHLPDLEAGYDHVADYLATLPGDTMLVNLRCHV